MKKRLVITALLSLGLFSVLWSQKVQAGSYFNPGSGSGTIATGSVITLGSPLTIGGNQTSTISGTTSSPSVFQNLNNIRYVPPDFATNGCAGSSTAKTFQGCVYAIYLSLAPIGGGSIWVTNDVTTTWTGMLSFNVNGDQVELNCAPNTILQYTGTGTSTAPWLRIQGNVALNYNFGNPIGHIQTSNNNQCNLRGHSALIADGDSNTATSTGIVYGGMWSYTNNSLTATTSNAGAVGVNIDYNVNGFGRNIAVEDNAYLDNFTGTSSGGNGGGMTGDLIYFNVAHNSGERNLFTSGSYTDPGNTSATNAIYVADGAQASLFFEHNSVDDAQIYCGASDGQCDISFNHIEYPSIDFPNYIPILNPSSDQSTQLTVIGNEFANDFTGIHSWTTIIKHGGQLYAASNHIDNYGGGTVTNFVDHSNDNGLESELVCQTQVSQGALTNIIAGGGNVLYTLANGSACWQDEGNSYPASLVANDTNINDFYSGTTVAGTYDHNGNWTMPGTLNVVGNVSTSGNFYVNGVAISSTTHSITLSTSSLSYTSLVDSSTSITTVLNSITTSTSYSYSVPAGQLTTATALRITANGNFVQNSGVTLSPFSIYLVYGGQVIASTSQQTLSSAATTIGAWEAVFTLSNTSSTSNQIGSVETIGQKGSSQISARGAGFGTVDSTQAQTLQIWIADTTTTPTVSVTQNNIQTELVGARQTVVTNVTYN